MSEFIDEFWHLLSSPAHTAVEFTFVALDYIIIHTVASRLKRHFHRDLGVDNHHDGVAR